MRFYSVDPVELSWDGERFQLKGSWTGKPPRPKQTSTTPERSRKAASCDDPREPGPKRPKLSLSDDVHTLSVNAEPQYLPNCSWFEFCKKKDIPKPTWAIEFLHCLAAHYRSSGKRGLPAACTSMAEVHEKDPYIMWLSMLTEDFPHDARPSEQKEYDMIDKNYLLSVMRMYC